MHRNTHHHIEYITNLRNLDVVTVAKNGANTVALTTLNAGKEKEEGITVRQCNVC